jgi:Zn-dependent membrane protease YugP
VQWVLLAGILTIQVFPALLFIGIIMFALTTLFSFITLPVEFDASNRALKWLNNNNILSGAYLDKASNALNWAASTYVVAALSSLATLMYYVMIYLGGKRND